MLAGSAARFLATAQALTDGDLCQADRDPRAYFSGPPPMSINKRSAFRAATTHQDRP
jgi:hypothetical protein